jgi:hypothetical protein
MQRGRVISFCHVLCSFSTKQIFYPKIQNSEILSKTLGILYPQIATYQVGNNPENAENPRHHKAAIEWHKINPYQKPGSRIRQVPGFNYSNPGFQDSITAIQTDCNRMSSQSHVTEIQRRRKAYQRM